MSRVSLTKLFDLLVLFCFFVLCPCNQALKEFWALLACPRAGGRDWAKEKLISLALAPIGGDIFCSANFLGPLLVHHQADGPDERLLGSEVQASPPHRASSLPDWCHSDQGAPVDVAALPRS